MPSLSLAKVLSKEPGLLALLNNSLDLKVEEIPFQKTGIATETASFWDPDINVNQRELDVPLL